MTLCISSLEWDWLDEMGVEAGVLGALDVRVQFRVLSVIFSVSHHLINRALRPEGIIVCFDRGVQFTRGRFGEKLS